MLELSGITKILNKNRVLDGISLSITTGEFFAILGPSGSGETSLLNVIAGLLKQDSGSIVINSIDVTNTPPNKRNIGMVFQNFFVYPHLDVYENIRYPLRYINSYKTSEIPGRIQEVANLLNIGHLLKRKSYELSGGEKQRIALARAIIKMPSLFLLDEPLSSLDYQLRLKIRTELKHLHKTLNKTFIYVTHDQAEAFYLADRVAIMQGGRIVQVGTPRAILDKPNSLFTAKFVHSYYNELPVVSTGEGDVLDSEVGPLRIENDATVNAIKNAKGRITSFIKCQDILPVQTGVHAAETDNILFKATIKDVLYVSDMHLLVLDNGLRMTVLSQDYKSSDEITASIEKRNILLFDEERLLGSLG